MGSLVLLGIMGVVTFLNLIILKIKFESERYIDLTVDILGLLALNYMFGGSLNGMLIAMVASLCLSTWLYFSPPKIAL